MIEAKRDRETETALRATSQGPPAGFDDLLGALDELLESLANKAMLYSESDPMYPHVVMLAARRLMDHWWEGSATSIPGKRAARIEDTWRCAMIEARERAHPALALPERGEFSPEAALAVMKEEITTFQNHLPQLLREQAGRFVLIKGADILGTFPDRSAALREGYRRFGVVPFLVRQIADPEPVVYLPNVVP
jgi:hypothetical protein